MAGGGTQQSAARDSQPEPPPFTETNAFLFSAHRSKGQRLQGKMCVIGHRRALSKVEDTVRLKYVMWHPPTSDESDIVNENAIAKIFIVVGKYKANETKKKKKEKKFGP